MRTTGDLTGQIRQGYCYTPGTEQDHERGRSADRLAQEALRENERNLLLTLDSIGDGVISTDGVGHILRMNRVAQQLTAWPLAEAKGLHLSQVCKIVDSENGLPLTSPFEAAMRLRHAINLPATTTLLARTGQTYLISDSTAPILDDEDSAPSGIVLVFRDITKKNKLDIELQQATKLETIGRLAGGVAHEFNSLLTGIIGYSEMLLNEVRADARMPQRPLE